MARDPDRPRHGTRRQARDGVDSEKAKTVLSEATEATARRARRRGRKNTASEGVAQANERHQDREERGRRR